MEANRRKVSGAVTFRRKGQTPLGHKKQSSQRRDASACCQSPPPPSTSACPGRRLNVLCLGASCPSSKLVPPLATTLRTLTDSSQRTGAAIAGGRPDAVTLRDLIEREGSGS